MKIAGRDYSVEFILLVASLATGAMISILLEPVSWAAGWLLASGLVFGAVLLLRICARFAGGTQKLAWIIGIAFILRLGIGVGLMKALPIAGFPTDQQKAGYVFFDAYRRDTQAINLVNNGKTVISALTKRYASDQYGGLLATSMMVYRYLSGGIHRPFLILILSAFFGSLAIPFFWLSAQRILGEKAAGIATWIFALFPQTVILGASQMREPYLVFFLSISFFGFLEWLETRKPRSLWFILIGILGLILFSPGVILPFVICCGGWAFLHNGRVKIPAWIWILALMILVVGLLAFAFGVSQQEKLASGSPLTVLFNWFKGVVAWDSYIATESSGRLEFLFKSIPASFQLPFIILYGLFQPVLPAALLDTTLPIWRAISTFLSAGWYLALPVLIYGFFAALFDKKAENRQTMLWLSIFFWGWVFICSARAGGDQWDNPRYRSIFIFCLALISAWAWIHARAQDYRWLKRIFLIEAIAILFFVQWYASRYYQIVFRFQFLTTILIITIMSILIVIAGIIFDLRINGEKSNKV